MSTHKVVQMTLGLQPFILIEFNTNGDEMKAQLAFGGGVSQHDIRDLLELTIQSWPRPVGDAAPAPPPMGRPR